MGQSVEVVVAELYSASARLEDAAQRLQDGLSSVHDETTQLLGSGWQGGAASAYAPAWEQWHSGAEQVVEGLQRMSELLTIAGREYAKTDESASEALGSTVQGSGASSDPGGAPSAASAGAAQAMSASSQLGQAAFSPLTSAGQAAAGIAQQAVQLATGLAQQAAEGDEAERDDEQEAAAAPSDEQPTGTPPVESAPVGRDETTRAVRRPSE